MQIFFKIFRASKNLSLWKTSDPKMLKERQTSSSSFFLFPNPNPQMRSINIPEPIIHLPGIDPDSFLNPKPHADYELKPMAPLDVDPCAAALLTEVIANTTHLTASEHAGGSFTEPPMSPIASNSPAHSETSTPQIVNDIAETKIESKNPQIIHCDICNIMCNSVEKLREHKEGKKHLKKLQKPSVSSPVIQETPPPVANAASNHESDKKKQDFLENVPPVESLFTCNIPDLVCHVQNVFTEHPHGEKQETQVTNGPLDTSLSPTLFQSSNSGTEKVEDVKLCCEVCKITCSSKRNLWRHSIGKKHQKNLQISERIQSPPSTTPTPTASMATTPPVSTPVEKIGDSEEVRKVFFSNRKGFRKHVNGKKYRTNDPVENPKLTKGEVVNPKNGSFMRCELCGVMCTSKDELSRHLSGKKHTKTLHLSEKLKGHGDAPVAERMLKDVMSEEGKVVFLETGKRKANDSLASEEDADVKRKKMMEEGGASGASISCYLCNVVCTNLVAFRDHLAGQEHSAMVLKQV